MLNNFILLLVILFAILLSAFFAGTETGLYRLSRLRLRLGIERKQFPYVLLGKAMHDSKGLLLSLLVGNNIVNCIVSGAMTLIFFRHFGSEHTAEIMATVAATPILFIFGELIPKNVFYYRADKLMPLFSPLIFLFDRLFRWCGVVPFLKFFTAMAVKISGNESLSKTSIQTSRRPYIAAIVQDIHEEELFSPVQTDIINRLMLISHVTVSTVMTPIQRTEKFDIKSNRQDLLKKLEKTAYSRYPVWEQTPSNIIGFIDIYQCLSGTEEFNNLHKLLKPIHTINPGTNVIDAINLMKDENQKMLLVARSSTTGKEKPLGIITMKDLVEELVGELAEW
ncbi:MAG: CNNM domain-containing protein [Phycisphaerae bacterium]|nr:CNNM domain-containing protein [Phycisphaerae bacterium]